jgi:hypothetical protein
MQNLAVAELDAIETTIYHKQPIILLNLYPIGERDAKQAYIGGETVYITYHKNPVSFMECETIHISVKKLFKSAVDRWKSKNQGKPHYFTMERSIGGYY